MLFDGATFVKDLFDIDNLDLKAMLHDYCCLKHKVSSNLYCSLLASWLFYNCLIKLGNGKCHAIKRFIGLIIITPLFIFYSLIKRGFQTKIQKRKFLKEYNTLIK